jgi:hypothetical protein
MACDYFEFSMLGDSVTGRIPIASYGARDDGSIYTVAGWPFPVGEQHRIPTEAAPLSIEFDGTFHPASTPAEFERELSAERIPVGDAQEVDFDAGTKFYGPLGGMKPGRTFRVSEGWEAPRVDPMCAAMSQPAPQYNHGRLNDALATAEFYEYGPPPVEVPERAPERAKPPLAGFDVVHEGRWHL